MLIVLAAAAVLEKSEVELALAALDLELCAGAQVHWLPQQLWWPHDQPTPQRLWRFLNKKCGHSIESKSIEEVLAFKRKAHPI